MYLRKLFHYYILLATIIYIFIGALAISLVSGWIGEHYFNVMGENALNLAVVAANGLDITDEQLRELDTISFEELLQNESNQELSKFFEKTSLLQNVKYAYVIRKLDENEIKYSVTNLDEKFYEMPAGTSLDWIWLMDVIVNQKERLAAEQDPEYYADKNRYTHISGETEELYNKQERGYFFNNDEWGSQISGMVPIYTKEGQFIGLLGVDVYSDGFYTYRNKVICVLFLLLFIPSTILIIIFLNYHLRYRKEMKNIVFQDKVTGLYTRIYYENYARQQLKKLRNKEDSFTVIMIDVDDFKSYNDYYGHIKGDKILKQVGSAIRQEVIQAGGCPGRYGGEEFIAFFSNISLEKGDLLCENIRKTIEYLDLQHENRQNFKIITISLGIYTSTKQDQPLELKKLIDKADISLYKAKKDGKNCFRRIE